MESHGNILLHVLVKCVQAQDQILTLLSTGWVTSSDLLHPVIPFPIQSWHRILKLQTCLNEIIVILQIVLN